MIFTKISRILKTALVNFWRNGTINIATTSIMAVTLLLISILIGVNFLLGMAINNFKEKIDISVNFYSSAPEEEIIKIRDEVAALPQIASVKYVSKDEAWDKFRAKYADDAGMSGGIKELDENPLYATMSIKAKNMNDYSIISNFLSQEKYSSVISKNNFPENEKIIKKLSEIIESIQKWGLAIGLIFIVISIFVVFNAIRIAIHNYRHEIKIMRLVGAENWYIQLPFIIEGAIYGLIGSIVSIAILSGLIYMGSRLGFISLIVNMKVVEDITLISYLKQNILFIFAVQLAVGIFIGVVSSLFAMRRYLKV